MEKTYSFDDVPSAFEKVKAGHNRGKTVIDILGAESKPGSLKIPDSVGQSGT